MDQRGHGDSEQPPVPFDWWDLGRDCLELIDRLGWERAVGVGHSSGGAAVAMAELLRPGTFASLVLIEPIIFSGPTARTSNSPMAAGAERRRSSFPTPGVAFDSFAGRGPFARWDDRALAAYVRSGLRAQSDGSWSLKCRPEFEAECYRSGSAHGAWDRLPELGCPVAVVTGSDSLPLHRSLADAQAAAMGQAAVVVVEGATHFIPMERPDVVATLVAASAS